MAIIINPIPAFSTVTDEEYYKAPFLSNSAVTAFLTEISSGFTPKAGSSTLRTGQLLHMAVYEPHLYLATPEYISIDPEEQKRIRLIDRMAAAAIAGSPILQYFLASDATQYEVPVAFSFETPGGTAYFKVKPDALLPKYGHDLKSTAAKSLQAFVNTFHKYGYFRQAFIYKLGTGAKKWYFTGVSKTEPHQVFIVDTSKAIYRSDMIRAKNEILDLISTYVAANAMHKVRAERYIKEIEAVKV